MEKEIVNSNNDSDGYNIQNIFTQNTNKDEINQFQPFNSILFMNDYIDKDENQFSSNSNKINNNQDLLFSPSLEKCLTNELLDSITNESTNAKYDKKLNNLEKNYKDELKISKNLFNQENFDNFNEKIESEKIPIKNSKKDIVSIYEDTINGFEYQLKFIENSIQNIFPQSYKKNNYKNKCKKSFCCNNNYSLFNMINDENYNNDNRNKFVLDKFEKNENGNYQIHKLKLSNNFYKDWICKYCSFMNKGYRKNCIKCNNYKKY